MGTLITMAHDAAILRLMTWLSPAFPVGGYTYSHGIEAAVEREMIRNAEDLGVWVSGVLSFGSGRTDVDLLRMAWTAVGDGDAQALDQVSAFSRANRGTRELAFENKAQGSAFMIAIRAAWSHRTLDDLDPGGYAVAVGAAAAAWQIDLRPTLLAYQHALAANLVSAGVRLIPLGQTQGLKIMAALEEPIRQAAEESLARSPNDFGSAAAMVDWTSIIHETQYTRLFRS